MESTLNINLLPNEILLQIFSYLTHNELGQFSRVCRKWNNYAKSPVLWKDVDVTFYIGCGTKIVSSFIEKLSVYVTHLKLDLGECISFEDLNFEYVCLKLKEKCPNLYSLILLTASFTISLLSIINLCSDFLPNLKVLILPFSLFGNQCKEKEHNRHSQIEILDVSFCHAIETSDMHIISKMPCLKKLNLYAADVENNLFQNDIDVSFLQRLEYLNLGLVHIDSSIFSILQNQSRNLTELFLCSTYLRDNDILINDAFSLLKTICLRKCRHVTCDGIVSLVQSCLSLENVYVDSDIVKSYAKHPFITHNMSKLTIVKTINDCSEHEKLIYSFNYYSNYKCTLL